MTASSVMSVNADAERLSANCAMTVGHVTLVWKRADLKVIAVSFGITDRGHLGVAK